MAEYQMIINDLTQVAELLAKIEQSIAMLALREEKKMDIRLCVSEAVNNALLHGNKLDQEKKVTVVWQISSTELTITVADEGDGVPEEKRCPKEIDPMVMLLESGKGLYLIGQLATEVSYNQCGNQITIRMAW